MSWIAPLFLLGLGAIALPWILHRVRRPDQRRVQFSSTMFLPQSDEKVVRRRKIQHLLLMLLRMAILVLLALAFARPYFQRPPVPVSEGGATRQLVLVDLSGSMTRDDRSARANDVARRIIRAATASDSVGLAAFDSGAHLVEAISPVDEDQRGRLNAAIEGLQPTEGGTRFVSALQFAEREVTAPAPGAAADLRRVIHLVTDAQAAGMSEAAEGWRLPPGIELIVHPVAGVQAADQDLIPNTGFTRLAVSRPDRQEWLRLRARLKRWGDASESRAPLEVNAMLFSAEGNRLQSPVEPQQIDFLAGDEAALNLRLPAPSSSGTPVLGALSIEPDAYPSDDRMWFAWSPENPPTIRLLVADKGSGALDAATFIRNAVNARPRDWNLIETPLHASDAAAADDVASVAVTVLPDLGSVGRARFDSLLEEVKAGAGLLAFIDPSTIPADADLQSFGIRRAASPASIGPYAMLGRIDFTHPVFQPFAGSEYNNFSPIRFRDYAALSILPSGEGTAAQAVRALARFEPAPGETEGRPALVEATLGQGRVIVAAFPLDLSLNNLPRDIRFVPLLTEMLRFLAPRDIAQSSFMIGEPLPVELLSGTAGPEALRDPAGGWAGVSLDRADVAASTFHSTGLWRWRDADARVRYAAVNHDPGESDPTLLSAKEIAVRLSSSVPAGDAATENGTTSSDGVTPAAESLRLGRLLLLFLAAVFLFEGWYALRLLR